MKKSILAVAVLAATTMAATAAVAAPTAYGNIHLSLDMFDKSDGSGAGTNGDFDMASQTSAFGLKGSEDLGDGMKAIYKLEWQVDVADGGALGTGPAVGNAGLIKRDQFVGLKGGLGTIKFGTMSSNYKQMGGKIDPFYRTAVEGRNFMETQSELHRGRGSASGRMTNLVQYVSPKMGGIQLVANTTFTDSADEALGLGLRWSNKAFLAYFDYLDQVPRPGSISTSATEAAMKFGGKFSSKAFSVGLQYEDSEDLTGSNYVFASGKFNFNKNNAIALTVGQKSHINDGLQDTTGIALGYDHKLSKLTNVYVAYGDKSSDTATIEDSVFTLGIRKKF